MTMIDRQHNRIVFECDSCTETFEAESSDFSDAWEMARAEGWKAKKFGNEWLHYCGQCRNIA